MSDGTTIDGPRPNRGAGDRPPILFGCVERYDDAPDEFTLYPADCEESEVVTTWISAREGSYVDVEAMR